MDMRHAGEITIRLDPCVELKGFLESVQIRARLDRIRARQMLAQRVIATLDWLAQREDVGGLPVGLFGASTGAAAALIAAAAQPSRVQAVVSRGGRPDLAGDSLPSVRTPTLLIVGSEDMQVLQLNRAAMSRIPGKTQLSTIEGASHLFEEPGTLDQVARHAADWFKLYLAAPASGAQD